MGEERKEADQGDHQKLIKKKKKRLWVNSKMDNPYRENTETMMVAKTNQVLLHVRLCAKALP